MVSHEEMLVLMAATLWQSIPIHGNGGHPEARCL